MSNKEYIIRVLKNDYTCIILESLDKNLYCDIDFSNKTADP